MYGDQKMSDHLPDSRVDVPLHRFIAEAITQKVTNGELKPGQKLPSERKIAMDYQASRATVRTALNHLEQTGLISRRERRSAVVALRRDITPSIRIACGNTQWLNLFRRLGELQKLPARYQLQYIDLHQPDAVNHMISKPAESVDIVICDLEDSSCFTNDSRCYSPIPKTQFPDIKFSKTISHWFENEKAYQVIPLGIWPMLLYVNSDILQRYNVAMPTPPLWQWHTFEHTIKYMATHGMYGLQLRPTLKHMGSLAHLFNTSLFSNHCNQQQDQFLKLFYDLLHTNKTIPAITKSEQINLFTQGKCMASLDGFDKYQDYKDKLGDKLQIFHIPYSQSVPTMIASGLVAVILPNQDSCQPAIDFARSLLNLTTQKIIYQLSGALPVRNDLLTTDTMQEFNISEDIAKFILNQLPHCKLIQPPKNSQQKVNFDNLLLEYWLGLDTLDSCQTRLQQLLAN